MEKILGNLKKGLVFVISAPAGTGKTTLARMIMDEFPCVKESISCTTRSIRKEEIPDVHYHFLPKEEFLAKIQANEFLEYAEVFGEYYGTLKSSVEKKIHEKEHVILVIDTQGALELKKRGYPATFIFIQPPSMGELRSRLFFRKTEDEADIEKRLDWAKHEIEMAKKYDYLITNDNLHRAYDILRSIFIAVEHKTEKYNDRSFNE